MPPTPYVVERTLVVPAAPAAVRPHLVDFHRRPAWSPWEDVDPAVQRTYSGEQAGAQKIFAMVVPMDRLVGKDVEKDLSRLAAAVA